MKGDATEGAAAGNETEKVEYENVTKTRKKTIRVPLKISGPGFTLPKLTPEQLKVGPAPIFKVSRKCSAACFSRRSF